MRASVSALAFAMRISFTETRNTPASRSISWVKPLTNKATTNKPKVSAMTRIDHGSEDFGASMLGHLPSGNIRDVILAHHPLRSPPYFFSFGGAPAKAAGHELHCSRLSR